MSLTVERTFHLGSRPGRKGGYHRVVQEGPEPEPLPSGPLPGRTPRISRLMALAIRCDQLLRSGAVPDATALASLAHVTQPRMTQILNLTLLAPDIQEALLCLSPVVEGKPEISEKGLRPVCAEMDWEDQKRFVEQAYPSCGLLLSRNVIEERGQHGPTGNRIAHKNRKQHQQ